MAKFVGRQAELKRLFELTGKKSASLVVVKGRRRIGKSRLIKEFSRYFDKFYSFVGLAPDKKTTSKHQLDEFSRQISREMKTSFANYLDWSDAFWAIGERVKSGKILILFDEISWMGSKDPTFLAKIKNLWDLQLKENDQLVFIICGSASAWIEKNIFSSTGFVGRISLTLTLDELPFSDCNQFWSNNISSYEKFKILAITGGIPKYLEEINPKKSAEENIKQLCFVKGGFLVDEFEKIFSDIFLRESNFYKRILKLLADGPKELIKICGALNIEYHSRISEYLWELELAGFVQKRHTWNIKLGQDSQQSKYYLSDNYIRFYLKYIEKNISKINHNAYALKSLTSLPEWPVIMGLQFENMILNNRQKLHAILGVHAQDIICENPFFQKKTSKAQGCQIDYMIQTKFGTLYICEIKFSKTKIDTHVIQQVQTKIDTLKFPKGISCRPVLIHVNGVTEDLVDRDYFSAIIDVGEMFNVQ